MKKFISIIIAIVCVLLIPTQTIYGLMPPRVYYFNTHFTFSSFDELSTEFSNKGTDMFYELLEGGTEGGAKYEKHRKFELYKLFPQQTYIAYVGGEPAKIVGDISVNVRTDINYSIFRAESCHFTYTIELTSTDGIKALAKITVNHVIGKEWKDVYSKSLDNAAFFSSEYSKIHSVNLGGEEYKTDYGDVCVYEAYTRPSGNDGISGSYYYIFDKYDTQSYIADDKRTYITIEFLDNPLYENSELKENTGYTVPQEFLGNIDWLSKLTFKKCEFNNTEQKYIDVGYALFEAKENYSEDLYTISIKEIYVPSGVILDGEDPLKQAKELLKGKQKSLELYRVTADEGGEEVLKEPQWTVFDYYSDYETHAFKITKDGKLKEIEFIKYDDFTVIDIDEPGDYIFAKMDQDRYLEFIGRGSNGNTINNGSTIYIVIISIMAAIIVAGVVVVLLLKKKKQKKDN